MTTPVLRVRTSGGGRRRRCSSRLVRHPAGRVRRRRGPERRWQEHAARHHRGSSQADRGAGPLGDRALDEWTPRSGRGSWRTCHRAARGSVDEGGGPGPDGPLRPCGAMVRGGRRSAHRGDAMGRCECLEFRLARCRRSAAASGSASFSPPVSHSRPGSCCSMSPRRSSMSISSSSASACCAPRPTEAQRAWP